VRIILAICCLVFSWQGLAARTTCERGGFERELEVLYDKPHIGGCQLQYSKKDEHPGYKKAIYMALYERGFCQERLLEMQGRLEDWGWICKERSLK